MSERLEKQRCVLFAIKEKILSSRTLTSSLIALCGPVRYTEQSSAPGQRVSMLPDSRQVANTDRVHLLLAKKMRWWPRPNTSSTQSSKWKHRSTMKKPTANMTSMIATYASLSRSIVALSR